MNNKCQLNNGVLVSINGHLYDKLAKLWAIPFVNIYAVCVRVWIPRDACGYLVIVNV